MRYSEALEPVNPLKYVHCHLKGECCLTLLKRKSAITYTIYFFTWTGPKTSEILSLRALGSHLGQDNAVSLLKLTFPSATVTLR